MTLYKFNKLNIFNKVDTLINDSVLIDNRTEEHFRVLLYQIGSFYVEVFYDFEHNKIRKIKSFNTTSKLKPYLDKIDISELVF
jgi:hypothetical protein